MKCNMGRKLVISRPRVNYELGDFNNVNGVLISTAARKGVTLFECVLWDTRKASMDRECLNKLAKDIVGKTLEFEGAFGTCFGAYVHTCKVLGSDESWLELHAKFRMDANDCTRRISSFYHNRFCTISFDIGDGEVEMKWNQ